MGTPEAIKNYFFTLWSIHMKSSGDCTDQAALNYLYRFLREDETYSVSQPFNDYLCLTGEGVRLNKVSVETNEESEICLKDKPYCIVHQWDRFPEEMREMIQEKWS